MIETVLFAICLILGILGLADVLHSLKLCLWSIKPKAESYILLCLPNAFPQQHLRFTAEKYRWSGDKNIIAINSFINPEDFEECREIAEKNNITFCSAEELGEKIKGITGI